MTRQGGSRGIVKGIVEGSLERRAGEDQGAKRQPRTSYKYHDNPCG